MQALERDLGLWAPQLTQGSCWAAGRLLVPGEPGRSCRASPRDPGGGHSTWKCRMMVQIRPRVSLGLPSAMSSFLMFTSFTCERVALVTHTPASRSRPGWLAVGGEGQGPGVAAPGSREGDQGPGPPHLAVSKVVQGDLHILQLVEAHPPLLPGL